MSKKDVELYYDQVCDQYSQMRDEIKDFEVEAQKGLMEPERLDKIKESIQPLINNYQTLSWIMFLLNKPVKKCKHSKYANQNSKLLKSLDSRFNKDGILKQNNSVLENTSKLIKGE